MYWENRIEIPLGVPVRNLRKLPGEINEGIGGRITEKTSWEIPEGIFGTSVLKEFL